MKNTNPRKIRQLHSDWKFKEGSYQNFWNLHFDDSGWQTVSLPHDWSVTHPFDPKQSSGTGYLPGGTGCYRKLFTLDPGDQSRRAILTFDGIYKNSQVWVNGYYLGKRPSGYATFSYDVSPFLYEERENLLAVRVTHEDIADSRWFTGSGIYRKVTLTQTGRPAIAVDGVFIHTKEEDQKTLVHIETQLCDLTNDHGPIVIRHQIFAPEGEMAADTIKEVSGAQLDPVNQTVIIAEPLRWSLEQPFLYRCVTTLETDQGITDEVETIFGIRSIRFDCNHGFFLNGQQTKLKGVCIHHDAGSLGAAVPPSVWQRRLRILKEAGCNAIRMCHNPHLPELYDLCDQMGFLVIDEAFDEWEGIKNKWVYGHNVYPPNLEGYAEEFPQWHEEDLRSMILRDRNHPSVILFSIGNEIDYPNDPYVHPAFNTLRGNNDQNKPEQELIYDDSKPNASRIKTVAEKLSRIVHHCDPTRPVTAALAAPELSNLTGFADVLDVVGYNYKEECYDRDHEAYPNRIILGSENAKHIENWRAVQNRDFIAGLFLWTGIDFFGETQGWPSHGSESGLLDVAGFCKPSYYLWQSLWSDEPMVRLFAAHCEPDEKANANILNHHLTRAWNFTGKKPITVFCLTNLDEVRLWQNGCLIGRQSRSGQEGWFTFQVPFSPGELKAEAIGSDKRRAEDVLVTTGPAVAIKGTPDQETIRADGQDLLHLVIECVDGEGRRVCGAQDKVKIDIEGPGRLLSLENGDLSDPTPCQSPVRRAHRGRLLAYIGSTEEKGLIRIRATAEGLEPAVFFIISS